MEKRKGRRIWGNPVFVLATLLVLGAAAPLVFSNISVSPGVDRTVELSMKAFAFNENNPTLTFGAGETVRLIVRNDEPDPRVMHSFRIPGMNIRCETTIKPGESREYIFKAPESGDYVYTCCTHPGMGGAMKIAKRASQLH